MEVSKVKEMVPVTLAVSAKDVQLGVVEMLGLCLVSHELDHVGPFPVLVYDDQL